MWTKKSNVCKIQFKIETIFYMNIRKYIPIFFKSHYENIEEFI
jgi:hypothetical protein